MRRVFGRRGRSAPPALFDGARFLRPPFASSARSITPAFFGGSHVQAPRGRIFGAVRHLSVPQPQRVDFGLLAQDTALKQRLSLPDRAGSYAPGLNASTTPVLLKPLATLAVNGEIPNVHSIKTDTEGAGIAALRNASATLRQFRPILAISLHHKKIMYLSFLYISRKTLPSLK